MSYEKLYFELKEAYENLSVDCFRGDILKVVDKLKDLYLLETAKTNNQSKAFKDVMKLLSVETCKRRPILQKAIIKENKQIFTNSYILFILNNHILNIPTHDDENMINGYPQIDNIMPECNNEITLNVNELKNDLLIHKKDESYTIITSNKKTLSFDPNNLLYCISILNINDTITIQYKERNDSDQITSTMKIKNDNGTCIIVAMRLNN